MPLGDPLPPEEIFHSRGNMDKLGFTPLTAPETKSKRDRISRLPHRKSGNGVSGVRRDGSTRLASGTGIVVRNEQSVELKHGAIVSGVGVAAINGRLRSMPSPAKVCPKSVALRPVGGDCEIVKVLASLGIIPPHAVAKCASRVIVGVVPGGHFRQCAHPVAFIVGWKGPVSQPLGVCNVEEHFVDGQLLAIVGSA